MKIQNLIPAGLSLSLALAVSTALCAETKMAAPGPRVIPDLNLKLVWIPPGTFMMGTPESEPGHRGNESPQTRVTLTKGFWFGTQEVTHGQWKAMMGTNMLEQARLAQTDDRLYLIGAKDMMHLRDFFGLKRDDDTSQLLGNTDDDLPMIWVSWEEAMAFCQKLNERARAAGTLPAGYEYRLPTEAEWEYAARAGSQEATSVGPMVLRPDKSAPVLDAVAWYAPNSSVGYTGHTAGTEIWPGKKYKYASSGPRAVGTKAPNAWGLYDILGNVAEWCMDWDGKYPGGSVQDWKGPATGTFRVRRGGGWSSLATMTRDGYRNYHEPSFRWINLGFRLALAPITPLNLK